MRVPRPVPSPLHRGVRPAALAAPLLALALVATGCGGDEEEPAPPAAAAETTPAESLPAVTDPAPGPTGEAPEVGEQTDDPLAPHMELDVTVTDGVVDPPFDDVEVPLGSIVRLSVTSDVDDELHVHGLGDQTVELPAGQPVTVDLVADQAGAWEVETHESGVLLTRLVVR